jgi:hypothetical protein
VINELVYSSYSKDRADDLHNPREYLVEIIMCQQQM